jgi:drug/metabolite transporter (DMT)-like permease
MSYSEQTLSRSIPRSYRVARLVGSLESWWDVLRNSVALYFKVASKNRVSVFGVDGNFERPSVRPTASSVSAVWPAMCAVIVGSTILGLGAIFVKWANSYGATPLTVGTYRMLFALPGAYWLARRTGSVGCGQGRVWAILAGIAFFADVWLWHEAMTRTSAANATLILGGLCPVWVALISTTILGVSYGFRGWIGQCIGVGGAVVLAFSRGASLDQGRGEFLAVAASLCYAVFTLLLGRSRSTLRAAQALFWLTASAAICFLVTAFISGAPLTGYRPEAWLSLLGLGLLVHVVAWWLNSWGLGLLDAALGALGLQAQQVGTLLLAAWILHEPLRPLGVLGGVLIIGGILVNAFNVRRIRIDSTQVSHTSSSARTSSPRNIPGYGVLGRVDASVQSDLLRRRRSASWPAPLGWTMLGRLSRKRR